MLGWAPGYIPRIVRVLLAIAGPGYALYYLGPYFYPDLDVGFLFVTVSGGPAFGVWLLVRRA
jgi:hypothetical protein